MKRISLLGTLVALSFWSTLAKSEGKKETVTLYQIGANGSYCLSITPNASGCVSGTTGDGDSINLMEFVKDKDVVFKNLSDAPHDMKFSGANAENIPPQNPNGDDAIKKLTVEDLAKNKITCSFHGAQLEVGYKVLGPAGFANQKGAEGEGHQAGADRAGAAGPGGPGAAVGANGGTEGSGSGGNANLRMTGLADVSRQVLAKGSPADVQKLVSARPELMDQLKELRPMLAAEIAPRLAAAPGMKGGTLDSGALGGVGGGNRVAGGLPTGQGLPGQPTAAGRAGAGGGGSLTISPLNADGDEDFVEDSGAPRRTVIAGGNAAVVRLHPRAKAAGILGGSGGFTGGRGVASVGGGEPGSFRTTMKSVPPRFREAMWENGHFWLIGALLLLALVTARAVMRGTRRKS